MQLVISRRFRCTDIWDALLSGTGLTTKIQQQKLRKYQNMSLHYSKYSKTPTNSYWSIQNVLQAYQRLLKTNPILTKSVTSGVIACLGSSLSQVFIKIFFSIPIFLFPTQYTGGKWRRSFIESLPIISHIWHFNNRWCRCR